MNVLTKFIVVEGKRINVSYINPYHFDGVSRPTLRIFIPFEEATFAQCHSIMNNCTEIEEWGVVKEDDGTEVERLLTIHKNYNKDFVLTLNDSEQYPNHWMLDLTRMTEAEILAYNNREMNHVNEMALLDVYEAIMPLPEDDAANEETVS